MEEIIFQSHPDVILAGNTFRNVRTIIQVENAPLLEVGKFLPAGYGTRFPVFNSDGVKLAVVVANQIQLTAEGKKANLRCRHEPGLTVCELEGKPILELRREGAAALHGWAELYAPEGVLVKAHDSGISGVLRGGGDILAVGPVAMRNMIFEDFDVALRISDGQIAIRGPGVMRGGPGGGFMGSPGQPPTNLGGNS